MLDPFFTLNEPQLAFLAGLLGMILAATTLIACVVTVQYRKFRSRELELAFKDDLLDRGLSAAEIDLLWSGNHPGYVEKCLQALQRCWQFVVNCGRKMAAAGQRAIAAIVRFVSEYRTGRKEQELAFKREMLDRGLSVEEIRSLLAARQPGLFDWISSGCTWLIAATVEACRWITRHVGALSHKLRETDNGSRDWYWRNS